MQLSFTDAWPNLKASTIQVGEHGRAAAIHARDAVQRDVPGQERALAATRVVDELDHAATLAADAPGISLVPNASSVITAYELGRRIVRGAAGTPLAGKAHSVLGASELRAASDHAGDVLRIAAQSNATEVDRIRVEQLLDAAIGDARSGFAYLDHPAGEPQVVGALEATRASVAARGPVDPAPVEQARALLRAAADAALTDAAAPPAPVPSAGPAPRREVRLDLPRFELPPVPDLG